MPALHAPILGSRHLAWPDEAACAAFAAGLACSAELRDAFIALEGPLGAGKTTFARHLLRALGVAGRIKSPTFTVLEAYEAEGVVVAHFDFYRFDPVDAVRTDLEQADPSGFREVFASPGLKLVEWPDRAGAWLPSPDLQLVIEPLEGDARAVGLHARSAHGLALLPSDAPGATWTARQPP